MEPISIPDELVPDQHWRRVTVGSDDPEVRAVEAMIPMNQIRRYVMLIQCSAEDLEVLQGNGGLFWLQIFGQQLAPFSVDVVTDVKGEIQKVRGADYVQFLVNWLHREGHLPDGCFSFPDGTMFFAEAE